MKKFVLILALILSAVACRGQVKRDAVDYVTTPEDRTLAETVLAELKAQPDEEPGAQMVRAANALLGQPYVAGTLEELPQEKLCVYLTRTDCILFVETCLDLALTVKETEQPSFLSFARKVLTTGECNLLILDEVLEVVNKGIISVDDLKELVESASDTDVIITGSEMNVEVCRFADKISEIGNMQFKNY